MNILACSLDYKPQIGGIAEYTYNLCKAFRDIGHNIIIVAPEIKGSTEFDQEHSFLKTYRLTGDLTQVVVFSFKNILFKLPAFIKMLMEIRTNYRKIKKIIDNEKIDKIICFQWDFFGVIAYFLSKKHNISYYVIFHGKGLNEKLSFPGILQQIIVNKAHGIIANSQYTKNEIIKKLNNENKIITAYCGVDSKIYYKKIVEKRLIAKYGIVDRKVLLSIGRFVERKGFDYAIRAFREYLNHRPDFNVVYLIVGSGHDEVRLKKIVTELNLTENVKFLGEITDEEEKNNLYNVADIFILPCRELPGGDFEGFGIVYLEANCCEKPVIAGNSGGVPSAVQDGFNGLLVNPEDIRDIASKIELLFNDPDYARQLGQNGRIRAETEFSWLSVAKRININ